MGPAIKVGLFLGVEIMTRKGWAKSAGLALGALLATEAAAYVVNINTGTRAIYLRVGDGAMAGGYYANGGTPVNNGGAISLVQVAVPAAVVGNGVDQNMTGNGRLTSDYDGFTFCTAGQIYIGGFYRQAKNNPNVSATLRVTSPATLTSVAGDTIPITQISWTSSGLGDSGAQPIPAGAFTGGIQTLATNFQRNTWRESCHSFVYGNDAVVPAGTFNARVTYTLSSP